MKLSLLRRSPPRPTQRVPAAPRLNLGCGKRAHPEWVNLDLVAAAAGVIPHDLRQPLPFPDASFTAVYHSHVLEHLPRDTAPALLRECARVLKPGGILRVVVPDLETIVRLYLEQLEGALAGDAAAARRHEWMTLELLDQMVRDESGGAMLKYWRQNPMPAEEFVLGRMGQEVRDFLRGSRSAAAADARSTPPPRPSAVAKFRDAGEVHKWMYDRYSLRALLEQAGFAGVRRCSAFESAIPDFGRYALDVDEQGQVRKPDSLFFEAQRGGGG